MTGDQDSGQGSGGLRERTRQAVRAELAGVALALFVERGFDQTTVEDIARAAGLSKRSFFRYFASKEDAVLGAVEVMGEGFAADLRARPAGEDPWESLRNVLLRWERRIHASTQELASLRLIESTPTLRARFHQKRDASRQLIGDALRDRPGVTLDAFTADLLVSSAGAILDAVSREWLRTDGTTDRAALVDRAFALLRPTPADRTA